MEIAEREGIFTGGSGVKLHYRSHRIESVPFRAVLALIEAPADRGTLYADLVKQLSPGGFVLYGCAHHEHRRAPGQAGFLEEWNELYHELNAFLCLVRVHEPDAPIFLAGGHVAGQLVMTYALHHPEGLQGVIGFYPSLHVSVAHSPIVSLSRTLSRIWPVSMPTPMSIADRALETDVGAQQPVEPRMRSDHTSSDLTVTEAATSDIAIPVLVIERETPPRSVGSVADRTEAGQPSMKDVEMWLDRVLRGTSA